MSFLRFTFDVLFRFISLSGLTVGEMLYQSVTDFALKLSSETTLNMPDMVSITAIVGLSLLIFSILRYLVHTLYYVCATTFSCVVAFATILLPRQFRRARKPITRIQKTRVNLTNGDTVHISQTVPIVTKFVMAEGMSIDIPAEPKCEVFIFWLIFLYAYMHFNSVSHYTVNSSRGSLICNCGEFEYSSTTSLPESKHCRHTDSVRVVSDCKYFVRCLCISLLTLLDEYFTLNANARRNV